jgi:hypothetical protein
MTGRQRSDVCALSIEARADQYDTESYRASANERRDCVRSGLRGLKFEVPNLRHVRGLLCRKHGDRKPEPSNKNKNCFSNG